MKNSADIKKIGVADMQKIGNADFTSRREIRLFGQPRRKPGCDQGVTIFFLVYKNTIYCSDFEQKSAARTTLYRTTFFCSNYRRTPKKHKVRIHPTTIYCSFLARWSHFVRDGHTSGLRLTHCLAIT